MCLYFMLWIGQFSAMPQAVKNKSEAMGWIAGIDIPGWPPPRID